MRGTPPSSLSNHSCCGIIPAYAGNTRLAAWSAGCRGDHPRVCGEHVRNSIVSWCSSGSSPRMRGTRLATRPKTRSDGIIPAYAGNTSSSNRATVGTGDHPRVCGEHKGYSGKTSADTGSSPRMRGTPHELRDGRVIDGIIPAYAGNTRGGSNATADIRDHPRVCGEHTSRNSSRRRMTGSSPRMRGTRHRRSVRSLRAGIIPAYAGNTGWYVSRYAARRDHPRVCGEHEPLLLPKLRTLGSSPRMRGTPHPVGSGRPHPGIIPAYAGNTMAEL